MISIWIDKKRRKTIVSKINNDKYLYDGDMLLFEPKFNIEEAYIEEDGSIYATFNNESIGLCICLALPFGEWFKEALRFGSFDRLDKFLSEHQKEVMTVRENLNRMRKDEQRAIMKRLKKSKSIKRK
jgi:hypothetical protein